MTLDPTIREQTYRYFVQEAPELLQALEQGLLDFKSDRSLHHVHTLLRVTHTLKGASISVGLETIATVAHSLEDIFKALCQPDLMIDSEAEALLFEGVECLRLPLVAELTGRSVNHGEILDRTAAIFAQLQEKLGDCFDHNAQLPTSEELGFDVTQSIFEVGVAQRLEQLSEAIDQLQPNQLSALLRTQTEVFLGIAESLNLVGFAAIAQATMTALDQHPDQVVAIAQQALIDFREGQAAVLTGDRQQGGQPSPSLQAWAEQTTESVNPLPEVDANSLLESIWGTASADALETPTEPELNLFAAMTASSTNDWGNDRSFASSHPMHVSPPPSVNDSAAPSTVRVNVKHLDHLNYAVGELLTHQNRQLLQTEQLRFDMLTLRRRLNQHQQLLNQLRRFSDRLTMGEEALQQTRRRGKGKRNKSSSVRPSQNYLKSDVAHSQPVKPDRHSPAYLIQALLDDLVQLTESVDAIDLFARESTQTQEKQRHLLTNTRNALIEARMLPLGEVLRRFPQVLQQLETLHNKPVVLNLQGTDVLIDKAIAEKLYDPLLHLVRNAFDHGIETPTVRQEQGKSAEGHITIAAHNQGSCLMIEVRDDGKGIDFDQIRYRAVAQQRLSLEQASQLSQSQLIDLLFEPGFSTAAQVNDLSGRGIGLDVVQSQLKALRGSVTVQTQPHHGTTFTLQIPLNLTIASLLVCEAGSQVYALLDDAVEQILIPQSSHIYERHGCKALKWKKEGPEQLVPIFSLSSLLNYGAIIYPPANFRLPSVAGKETSKPIVLMRCQTGLLAIEVDRLIGEQELVIRPLGKMIEAPGYVQGASVLPTGQLALVLDGAKLVQLGIARQQANVHSHWSDSAKTLTHATAPSLLSADPSHQTGSISPPERLAPSQVPPNTRILVVEDSITSRQALVFTLQKAGYQVFQAKDGQEAIAQLQHQHHIRLVICDIEMPTMNGFEFLGHIQKLPHLSHIPVIILSSRTDHSYRSLAAQLGAIAYMTKPYIEHKLLATITDLLQQTLLNTVSE
ncbi:hybrid sensor histidine kinase/response regulator [Thermocoleostomius sinensis]|uniref:histidine kinase n=1 Tax=Thermocoleostomius sinensis A174 TaxID=2016057 RepID=A0A9E9CAV3_9CYAN|nr:response regulator [Thermocoleostomius sinensis]WAL61487.1 response regulator [Thermocoleostomius sinensis A174]